MNTYTSARRLEDIIFKFSSQSPLAIFRKKTRHGSNLTFETESRREGALGVSLGWGWAEGGFGEDGDRAERRSPIPASFSKVTDGEGGSHIFYVSPLFRYDGASIPV